MNSPLSGLIREDQSFFDITPTQAYWLDDDIDREYKHCDQTHGTVIVKFEVCGEFDAEVFKKSVDFFVRRHESLRASFHKKGPAFLMKVESPDDGRYEPEFIWHPPIDEEQYETLVNFRGHIFDIENGPLFLVRVISCKPDVHVITFKVHHVIFDGWSFKLLAKELFQAYGAFALGRAPALPVTEFQYKDYLALMDRSRRANYAADRKYWSEKYDQLPSRLRIPGAKQEFVPVAQKVIRKEIAAFPDVILVGANHLSRKFGVSLFVILQAAFNYYLLKKTGQRDILIGTYVFGRDYPGCDVQIGCYAKTVLIRTLLEPDDPFAVCITKVESANRDMRTRTGYPLRYFLEELLPAGFKSGGFYWNIHLQFLDERRGWAPEVDDVATKNGPRISLLPNFGNSLIQMDMQWSFVHLRDGMQLLIDYDGASFTDEIVKGLIADFSRFAGELMTNALCGKI